MTVSLRLKQQDITSYRRGWMGVSAVPGSGKTFTLAYLAAEIIKRGDVAEDQEVLIVTLVNSAVDNFTARIRQFLSQEQQLLPRYRICTLHSLAHEIVRQRPALAGVENDFQIIDERAAEGIRRDVVRAWLNSHPDALERYLKPDLDEQSRRWVQTQKLPDLVNEIALAVIRTAKDHQMLPADLRRRLEGLPVPLPLAEMGCDLYDDYQRGLSYRNAVDFDDLIRLALGALQSDADYLARLRWQWPFILEDEAQDSSRLQEKILRLLSGPHGNWVRVGDPNQAIYETFTTANPRYLRDFLGQPGVQVRELPNSGRSTISIIALANHLVEWTMGDHPTPEVKDALYEPPLIEPVPPDDPYPNPNDDPSGIHLSLRRFTAQEEVSVIADSLQRWLPEHQDWTVAVLAPRNQRAFELADELRRRNIPYEDSLLRASSATRLSAGLLGDLLRSLADPGSSSRLAAAYRAWRKAGRQDAQDADLVERAARLLNRLAQVEDFTWPQPERGWPDNSDLADQDPALYDELLDFRRVAQRWQGAVQLPIDQLVLTLAQDLLDQPNELALAHKLALLLRQANQVNTSWRLPELSNELGVISRNERRFLGFSQADTGFDPYQHRGKVVVATLHKAKGLEWDRVYLMSVNNYDFPFGLEGDSYISEKWFVRDRLNLEAEALAQLQTILINPAELFTAVDLDTEPFSWYQEGEATRQARLEYVRERLRLLYVGITRARQQLVVTWNTGRDGNLKPAMPFAALEGWWQSYKEGRQTT